MRCGAGHAHVGENEFPITASRTCGITLGRNTQAWNPWGKLSGAHVRQRNIELPRDGIEPQSFLTWGQRIGRDCNSHQQLRAMHLRAGQGGAAA
jgi:hypothetical protein